MSSSEQQRAVDMLESSAIGTIGGETYDNALRLIYGLLSWRPRAGIAVVAYLPSTKGVGAIWAAGSSLPPRSAS